MRYIWLIPLLPGIGAAINGLVGIRSFSRKTAGMVACTMMAAALGLALFAFWQLLGLTRAPTTTPRSTGFRASRSRPPTASVCSR
jgi:NADH:ubiquinone oxidoreductase subunit 5 (subunit L)/multisubunit Na+/H+ antiporter MnhA subunit